MKTCSDCGNTKPLSGFYTSQYVRKTDGATAIYHQGHCKACDVARNRVRRARAKQAWAVAEEEREAEEAMAEVEGVYVIGEVAFQDMLRKIAQSDEWLAEFLGTLRPVRNAQSVKAMRVKMQEAQEDA